MTLKQRWYRFKYLLSKRIAIREGRFKPDLETLHFFLTYLKAFNTLFERPRDLRKQTVVAQWRSIDGFLQHVGYATEIIEKQKDVLEPTVLLIHPATVTLYDFFLTEEKLPLSLKEVSEGLSSKLDRFLNALKTSQEKDKFRYQYYLRRYFHLIEALYVMSQLILDLGIEE